MKQVALALLGVFLWLPAAASAAAPPQQVCVPIPSNPETPQELCVDAVGPVLEVVAAVQAAVDGVVGSLAEPQNTSKPTISGTPRDGQILTAMNGTWTGNPPPVALVYQWKRDGLSVGANAARYPLTASDVGHSMTVEVTVVGYGVATESSYPTAVVAANAPSNQTKPVVAGAPVQGQTLTTTDGTWNGTSPFSYSRSWQRCSASGQGCTTVASGQSYTLGSADIGSTLRSVVTASNSAGAQQQASDPTPVVQANSTTGAGTPSASCTSPTAKIVDGYAGASTRVEFVVQQQDSRTTWICYRTSGSGLALGGRVDIVQPATAVGTPSIDSDYSACKSTPNNAVPPPHELLSGQLGDPSEPLTYVPFLIDSYYSSAAGAWICVQLGTGFQKRVIVPPSGVVAPSITPQFDAPATTDPPPSSGPAGYPSTTCQAAVSGTKRQVAAVEVATTKVWLYELEPSASQTDVCVRVQGAASAGGMLSVDTTGFPGVTPVAGVFGDAVGCGLNVISQTQPIAFSLTRSAGTNPASVCLSATPPGGPTTTRRVTLGTTGGATPPVTKWTADPDTP